MSKTFIRRSLLYIPGSSDKMLGKAVGVEADSVILDLEDSVSIAEKETARERVVGHIAAIKASGKEVIIRVNNMNTTWGILDVLTVSRFLPNTILVPKADERALIIADGLLGAVEAEMGIEKNSISIIPLFETTCALADPLAVLSATPRIVGAQLGAEDLANEQEILRTSSGEEIWYARQQLAMAARAKRIDILDTPYIAIHDLAGVRKDAETAKKIGYTGKTCIHPSHLRVINEVFSPTEEEIVHAKNLLAAYEAAVSEGRGACTYQNKMVDFPIAEQAKRIIQKAEHIAQLNSFEEA